MPSGRAIAPLPPQGLFELTSGVDPARSARSPATGRIRRIRPADHDALRVFYATLSDESRRTRFLGSTNGIGDCQSTYFCCPDHDHREGFIATAGTPGPAGPPVWIVGHACIEPDGPSGADLAVAVADELHGRGIGRRLVELAIDWARREGFATLTATMMAANPAIQRLLTSTGRPTTTTFLGAGLVEIRIALERVDQGPAARRRESADPTHRSRD